MAEPASIFERMAAIVAELPAIGKDEWNEQQRFKYRGHDHVMNALKPLLGKHQVFMLPEVLERVVGQRTTSKGTVLYEVNLNVRYTFYGPQGDYVTAAVWGEGTDAGDKATNKAMTMALKNAVAQSFAVSTEEQLDTDGSTDPDTVPKDPASGSAGPAKQTRKKPEAKKAASGSAAGKAERDNENSGLATEEQRQTLYKLAEDIGVDGARFREILQYVTGQQLGIGITADKYQDVVNAVKAEGVPFA